MEREFFRLGAWAWDVTVAKSFITEGRETHEVPVKAISGLLGLIRLDEQHATQVSLEEPLIVAPSPDGQGHLPIDGWHRILRASTEGIDTLRAYVLTDAESLAARTALMTEKAIEEFHVGEQVWLRADQNWRLGRVTKIGRTRLSVRHPRNKQGDLVERAYGLDRIVLKQVREGERWLIFWANGSTEHREHPVPDMPITLT